MHRLCSIALISVHKLGVHDTKYHILSIRSPHFKEALARFVNDSFCYTYFWSNSLQKPPLLAVKHILELKWQGELIILETIFVDVSKEASSSRQIDWENFSHLLVGSYLNSRLFLLFNI